MAEDLTRTKICTKCLQEKALVEFGKAHRGRNGRHPRCKRCVREYKSSWFGRHPGKRAHYKKTYYQRHPEKVTSQTRDWRHRNYDAWRTISNRSAKTKYWQTKLEVFVAYGGACECCGERRVEFLTIDHVKGGGHQHRKQIHGHIYDWLKRRGFPKGLFRLLCMNCNWAKRWGDKCPHEIEQRTSVAAST